MTRLAQKAAAGRQKSDDFKGGIWNMAEKSKPSPLRAQWSVIQLI